MSACLDGGPKGASNGLEETPVAGKVTPLRSGKQRFPGSEWRRVEPAAGGGQPIEAVEEVEGVPEIFGDGVPSLAEGAVRRQSLYNELFVEVLGESDEALGRYGLGVTKKGRATFRKRLRKKSDDLKRLVYG
jgi:hypothetical protein